MGNEPTMSDIMREMRLGGDLSESNQRCLAERGQVLELNAEVTIFREGDKHPLVYWLVDGHVALDMSTGGTAPKLLLTLSRGDLLAWSAMLGAGRMTSTAKTIEATRLLAFDANHLKALCRSNHEIGYHVMEHLAQQLAGRLLATRLQLLDLFGHPNERTP